MHLEVMRYALYRESIAFLAGDDEASVPQPGTKQSQAAQQQSGATTKRRTIYEYFAGTEKYSWL